MISSSNLVFHETTFEQYLELPQYSFSGIKNKGEIIVPTKKMSLGTSVHNYLLDPEKYNYKDFDLVRPIAFELKKTIGSLFKFLKTEQAFTSDFTAQGFTMPYKGRIDLLIPKSIVIDIKVSELDLNKSISYFEYDNQVSGYAIATQCPLAIIISIHPKKLTTQIKNIPINHDWWEYQIIQYGKPN